MSQHLTQAEILEITGYRRQRQQEDKLRELGYIVLGRSANNQVRALALHPDDPRLRAANDGAGVATLRLD